MPVTDFLQKLQNRRTLLRQGMKGLALAAGAGLTGKLANAALTATPTETEGPFWIDEKLNRSDVRTDTDLTPVTTQTGMPLRLTVNVSKLAGGVSTPVSGAYVDIWHCNYQGYYSDVSGSGNPNEVGHNFLRGYQITDNHGIVRFLTIYPGWYSSRTTHIHARVRIYSGTTATTNFTTQFFFDETITTNVYKTAPYNTASHGIVKDTTNAADSVYKTVTSSVGSTTASPDGTKLLLRMSNNGTYVIGSFNIVLV